MNILEIAKECGAETHDVGKREGYLNQLRITFDKSQLEAFAAAVIEDYKKSLVPVAFMWANGSCNKINSYVYKHKEPVINLYALPLGETK